MKTVLILLPFILTIALDSFATSPKVIYSRQAVQLNLPFEVKKHLKNIADQYQPSPQEEIEEECIKTMKFFNPFAIADMEWKVTPNKKKQLAYYIYHLELIPYEVSFMMDIWYSLHEFWPKWLKMPEKTFAYFDSLLDLIPFEGKPVKPFPAKEKKVRVPFILSQKDREILESRKWEREDSFWIGNPIPVLVGFQ